MPIQTLIPTLIKCFFINLSIIAFLLALLLAAISIVRKQPRGRIAVSETFFRWIILLPVGVVGIYTFVMHAFFSEIASASIGWKPSPFEYEVAIANLSFGLLGLLAFRASYGFRAAAGIGNIVWLGGDAIGHIRQMIVAHNFSPGNAGPWFWTDVLIPISLLILLLLMRPKRKI